MPLDKDLALLGPPELSVDGRTLAFRERRALGLLAFLGEAGRPVSRDDAATPLWPDAEPEGRTRLRRLVYKTNDLAALPVIESPRLLLQFRKDASAESNTTFGRRG